MVEAHTVQQLPMIDPIKKEVFASLSGHKLRNRNETSLRLVIKRPVRTGIR
jgi:hypothetical protein